MAAATAPKIRPVSDQNAGVPLEDITITWKRQGLFIGEEGQTPTVTLTGEHLATILQWLTLTHPSGDFEPFGHPEHVALHLAGLAEIVSALSDADLRSFDQNAMFCVLGEMLGDFAHRLNAKSSRLGEGPHAIRGRVHLTKKATPPRGDSR